MIVAPSILAADFSNMQMEFKKIHDAGAEWVHIDVMDGHFVPNLTFGPPIIKSFRPHSKEFFDVHLMVSNPEALVDDYINAGAQAITFHWEATVHHHRLIQYIKSKGIKAGISIVPSTPVEVLKEILKDLDLILVMSVNPGFGGQSFIPNSLNKIKTLSQLKKDHQYSYLISVDGGVTRDNYKTIIEAGVEVLVAGSSFFKEPNPKDLVNLFKEGIYGGQRT